MSSTEIEVVSGEVISTLTLEELAVQLNREHHLVEEALSAAMQHAIRCGEILLQVRDHIGNSGKWGDWVDNHFDGPNIMASYYMRIFEYQQLVQGCPNVYQAMKRLKGMPAIRGTGGSMKYEEEIKEEARKLYATGMTKKEIANLLDINRHTIARWVDPEILRRHNATVKERNRQQREERKRKKQEAAHRAAEREARRVGGSLAESYSLIHKLATPLAMAARNADDPEVKRLLNSAIYHQHKALDDIVEALGRS